MAATTKSGHTSKSAQTSKSAATARSARSGAGPAGPGARYMVRSRARTSTIDAMQMHEAVTPDPWCVTKMDLRHLRLEVLRWLQDGEIQSNPDTEDSDDEDKYGPSIYSVNEQYIKPVTADAGKMSWALMMNPEGLDCDLFVSHAWQEGIFEFLSKVLGSWPFWVRHAWCCMLANPQHLNIGSMLQSPKTSPFALALEASRLVLVVSNRRKSVYCRLWCGYEAYVASEKSKVIQIAKPLQIRSMCWTFGLALLPLAGGLIFGGLGRWQNWDLRLGVIFIALALLASANTHHVMRQASNYMGLAVSACLAVSWIPLPTVRFIWVLPPAVRVIYNVLLWLCVLAFFLLAEVDRARSEDIACEGQKLRKGYRGSICQASCSEAADKRRIWDEIGNNVHQVDHAINVLISAGLSSPALRACAEKGVEIEGAGHAESAIPLVFLGPQLLVGLSQVIIIYLNGQNTADPGLVLEALAVVARIAFIILICKSAPDERCFMFKVITKLVTVIFFPSIFTIVVVVELGHPGAAEVVGLVTFMCFNLSLILALIFGLLGIQKTLQLPGGPCLLQMVFWHASSWGCAKRNLDSSSDEETD